MLRTFWSKFDIDIKKYANQTFKIENKTLAVSGFVFYINRKSATYQWTYFIPCSLMVVLSWMSFLIKPDVVPGRVGLLLTLLLMVINLSNTVSRTSPVSGRLNPLLTWIQTSIAFVFLALVEYASLLFKAKFGARQHISQDDTWKTSKIPVSKPPANNQSPPIDGLALIVFPSAYIIFLFIFWIKLSPLET